MSNELAFATFKVEPHRPTASLVAHEWIKYFFGTFLLDTKQSLSNIENHYRVSDSKRQDSDPQDVLCAFAQPKIKSRQNHVQQEEDEPTAGH